MIDTIIPMILTLNVITLAMIIQAFICKTADSIYNFLATTAFLGCYIMANIISLVETDLYFIFTIMLSVWFLYLLYWIHKATLMIVLLAISEVVLASIDFFALISYHLRLESLYQSHFGYIEFVSLLQLIILIVANDGLFCTARIRSGFNKILTGIRFIYNASLSRFIHHKQVHRSGR